MGRACGQSVGAASGPSSRARFLSGGRRPASRRRGHPAENPRVGGSRSTRLRFRVALRPAKAPLDVPRSARWQMYGGRQTSTVISMGEDRSVEGAHAAVRRGSGRRFDDGRLRAADRDSDVPDDRHRRVDPRVAAATRGADDGGAAALRHPRRGHHRHMAACVRSSKVRATASWRRSVGRLTRVHAAITAQRMLAAEEWTDGLALNVRMALHTGEAQLRDEGNYFGLAVIRCARLRACGHGGQVLAVGRHRRAGRRRRSAKA